MRQHGTGMTMVGHFLRLETLRDQLEDRLFLYEERRYFGDDDVDDGTALDLRIRIRDLSQEIGSMRHGSRGAGAKIPPS